MLGICQSAKSAVSVVVEAYCLYGGSRFAQSISNFPDLLSFEPRSLCFDRSIEAVRPNMKNSYLGQTLLTVMGYYTKQSLYRRGAHNLFQAILEKAEEKEFYKAMEIDYDFPGTQSVMSLHMWLLIKRLGQEKEAKKVVQFVYDYFLEDVEIKLAKTGVKVRFNSLLQDLEKRFYGGCMAYDYALESQSKEMFTEALIRNVYQRAETKYSSAELLEKYLKRELECLKLTDRDSMIHGKIKFTSFSHEKTI